MEEKLLQAHNSHQDISDYVYFSSVVSFANSQYQMILRWTVAMVGAIWGPRPAGRLNVRLWRLRGHLIKILLRRTLEPDVLHFIHVPRTGGTSGKRFIRENGLSGKIFSHYHGTKVYHLNGAPWMMLIRDPLERLESSFYQVEKNWWRGKKTGLQKKAVSWRLRVFPGLIDVAKALSSRSFFARFRAYLAINAAGELTEPLASWVSVADLRKNPPAFVGHHDDTMAMEQYLRSRFEITPVKKRGEQNARAAREKNSARERRELQKSALLEFFEVDTIIYKELSKLTAGDEKIPSKTKREHT